MSNLMFFFGGNSKCMPGVQKFIFDAKFGIPIQKNIELDIQDHFLSKWPLYLDQVGSQQLPVVQKFIFKPNLEFPLKKH